MKQQRPFAVIRKGALLEGFRPKRGGLVFCFVYTIIQLYTVLNERNSSFVEGKHPVVV